MDKYYSNEHFWKSKRAKSARKILIMLEKLVYIMKYHGLLFCNNAMPTSVNSIH